MSELSEADTDVLSELFNIGIGKATASLSQLVNQKVRMSVPQIRVLTSKEVDAEFGVAEVRMVQQKIFGGIKGGCILIFPDKGEIDVVRAMVGDNVPAEMLIELQDEALSELGNIIINACVGAIARTIGEGIRVDVPQLSVCPPRFLLMPKEGAAEPAVLMLRVSMALDTHDMEGVLAFVLETTGFQNIRGIVSRMVAEVAC